MNQGIHRRGSIKIKKIRKVCYSGLDAENEEVKMHRKDSKELDITGKR